LNSAKRIVNLKFEKILQMTRGDAESAKRIAKKALTKRFSKSLKELEARILKDEENALDM